MEGNTGTDRLVKRIEISTCILLGVTTGAAGLLFDASAAVGVFLGGMIVALSFQVLKWQLLRAFLTPGRLPQKGRVFLSYYLRFLATLLSVFLVIHFGWADPVAFVVGLSVVVLSILVVGGFEFTAMLTKKGDG
ncbi:MAG: ATP synthase subunit I [Syntrophobacteraceae bacterium]|nr:ATP synthase subunit I [Syntrophobacteraceae bacterium]